MPAAGSTSCTAELRWPFLPEKIDTCWRAASAAAAPAACSNSTTARGSGGGFCLATLLLQLLPLVSLKPKRPERLMPSSRLANARRPLSAFRCSCTCCTLPYLLNSPSTSAAVVLERRHVTHTCLFSSSSSDRSASQHMQQQGPWAHSQTSWHTGAEHVRRMLQCELG